MGRGYEVLIYPFGAMAILSLCAFFTAFFNRIAAKVFVAPTVVLSGLLLLVILTSNNWNFGWLLFLLWDASPLILILYGSLILSGLALWAPLRHLPAVATDGTRRPGGPRWRILALAATLTASGVGYGIAQLIEGQRGEEKTRALLAGDQTVWLRRIQIDSQQWRVICTAPEVLRYLEGRIRAHEPEPVSLGISYDLSLSFGDGGTQAFYSYFTATGDFNLFLGEPGEGGKGHGIRLTSPRPHVVDEMVSFLLKPYHEIAGTVLILEASGSRVERNESLVVR